MGSSWVVRHRNAVLLALLLGAYTVQSFAIDARTGGLISDGVLTAMELGMFFIVFERRSERLTLFQRKGVGGDMRSSFTTASRR